MFFKEISDCDTVGVQQTPMCKIRLLDWRMTNIDNNPTP